VPGVGDTAVFSASSTKTCAINTAVNVAGFQINSGYTGTITQNSGNTITIGSSGFVQSAGTFTGSSGDAITINGLFQLNGGTFTSTGGTLEFTASSTFSGGTFNNNSGKVEFVPSGVTTVASGSFKFYNLQVGAHPVGTFTLTIATGTTITVQGYFIAVTDQTPVNYLGGGVLDIQGNIETAYVPNYATGTVSFVLDGTGTQIVGDDTVLGGGYAGDEVVLPNLTIQKPSGGVTLAGNIEVSGNWTNTSGTIISPGTSTVAIGPSSFSTGLTGITATITGSSTFNNLIFGAHVSDGSGSIFTVATGTVLSAQGYFYPNTDANFIAYLGGGAIDVQGNVETGYENNYATGTVNIILNGTGSQVVGDDTMTGGGYGGDSIVLPNLIIQKPSGGVTLAGNIEVSGNWTNTSGAIIGPGTSTIMFGPAAGVSVGGYKGGSAPAIITITGSSTFNNLVFGDDKYGANSSSSVFTIATGTTLVAGGYLYSDTDGAGGVQYLGGGTIDVQGNIEAGYVPGYATGTVSIVLDGMSTQIVGDDTLAGHGYTSDATILPDLAVIKNLSTAYIEGPVRITGSASVSNGELQLATSTSGTIIEIDGPLSVSSGARLSDYAIATSTIYLGSSVVNNGMVFFDGSGGGCTATLPNYVMINSTTTGVQVPWSGSGSFIMRYVGVEDQGGSTPITVLNGTNNGDNSGSWTFATGPEPQLLQSISASSTSASSLALPVFGFYPRSGDLLVVAVSARNQSITAPTDNASDTYILVASTTITASPNDALGLYYAKNVNTTSSFVITAHGAGGGPLSAAAFEYTGIDPSSTLDTYRANTDNSGTATSLTSLFATGHSASELYFGAMTFAAPTSASGGSGWTTEAGVADNSTHQTLYTEDVATTTELTTAATWTSVTSTNYGAIIGVFASPFQNAYQASGTLDSATFDTKVAGGAQLNSFVWQGYTPSNSAVDFQFAVSNASNGPWNFEGPDGTANSYFCGSVGVSIPLVSTNCTGGGSKGYNLFSGYRYFRYRVILFSDSTYQYTPVVTQVTVNWSP
jgi:hypothetical protein